MVAVRILCISPQSMPPLFCSLAVAGMVLAGAGPMVLVLVVWLLRLRLGNLQL